MTTITNVSNTAIQLDDLQDAIFTVIQSTPRLQEMLFESLFFLASAHLGRTKRKEVHGINARTWGYMDAKEAWAQSQINTAINDGAIIIHPQGKINNKQTVTVRANCGFVPTFIGDALDEINNIDGTHYSRYEIASYEGKVNRSNPILAVFLQEYWDDMLTYAIHHDHYHRNWQSFTPAQCA
tara:strand:+ start:22 stop:567 length:546 start_codon:yes stop_codon:yes gene_type:complete